MSIVGQYEIGFFFAWYDLWIGAFYDQKKRILYICPLPCCVIRIKRNPSLLRGRFMWLDFQEDDHD